MKGDPTARFGDEALRFSGLEETELFFAFVIHLQNSGVWRQRGKALLLLVLALNFFGGELLSSDQRIRSGHFHVRLHAGAFPIGL